MKHQLWRESVCDRSVNVGPKAHQCLIMSDRSYSTSNRGLTSSAYYALYRDRPGLRLNQSSPRYILEFGPSIYLLQWYVQKQVKNILNQVGTITQHLGSLPIYMNIKEARTLTNSFQPKLSPSPSSFSNTFPLSPLIWPIKKKERGG